MPLKENYIDPKFMIGDEVVFQNELDKIAGRKLIDNKYWLYHLENFIACAIHEDCLEFRYGRRQPVQWAAYHRNISQEHNQILDKIAKEGRWLLNQISVRCPKDEVAKHLNVSILYVDGLVDGNRIHPEVYERLIPLYEKHYLFLLEHSKNAN